MPGSKDPNVIDGLSSIRAVRRAGESGHGRTFKTRPSQNRLPDRPEPRTPNPPPPASRIGRTVIPRKHDLLCYECGYAFVIPGLIHKPICPKCHRNLVKDDVRIDSEWSGNVKTIGNVEIKSGGVITSGQIVARDIIVEGDATKGRLHAGRQLELGQGARVDLATSIFKDMRIRPSAKITLRHKLVCHDLLVEGQLQATVQANGTVHIAAGGHLKGRLVTGHFTVADGGGLTAKVQVRPESAAQQ